MTRPLTFVFIHSLWILTIQPCHAGVVNFELVPLQVLHGEMGAE